MSKLKMFCLECEYSNQVVIRKFYRFRIFAFLGGLCIRHDENGSLSLLRPDLLSCVLLNSDGEVIRFFFKRVVGKRIEEGN